ncbi:hypothetical protein OSB04_013302 [Centaurea solstitialis]|uniref:Uncharacterized protein n=1 Tax=Centaurea solstitialis TaxID=347529 RepID=A0AA38TD02_9ASTR|nr:hypothetical protein OSB04_013302 [Centaurea solstitialis]
MFSSLQALQDPINGLIVKVARFGSLIFIIFIFFTSSSTSIVASRDSTETPDPRRGTEHVPRVDLEDPNPLLTEVTPETRMFDNVMKAVAEAMNKQQESFVKMLEDREASQRRNEAVGENAGNGSGDAEVVVATGVTRMTGEKEKAKAKGCSYKNFLGCKPPEFCGCNEPITCLYWLREMEMAFEASECNDSQRVKFASHLLKGEALTWWNLTRTIKHNYHIYKITFINI